MASQHDRKHAAAVSDDLNGPLEADKSFGVQIMRIVDEKAIGFCRFLIRSRSARSRLSGGVGILKSFSVARS